MRITNRMMINNSLANINVNKNQMNTMDTQLSTQKKISRPSEDPIIAIRALRFRSSLNEIEQYLRKNIPDARSWMSVTEGAMDQANDIIDDLYEKCNHGATDTLATSERKIIAESLSQLKEGFYAQGNVDYAGRYVFTGFKTDSSLTYQTDSEAANHFYTITQNFTGEDIRSAVAYTNTIDIDSANDATLMPDDIASNMPKTETIHKIMLGYSGIEQTGFTNLTAGGTSYAVTQTTDTNAVPGADEVLVNSETGELILGDNVFNALKNSEDISFTYDKSEFSKGDVKPEHYFTCVDKSADDTADKTDTDKHIEYTYERQDIDYTINYAQKLKVNTQADEAFSIYLGRDIDNIVNAVQVVNDAEDKIAKLKDMKNQDAYKADDAQERIDALLEAAQKEYDLAADQMQKAFDAGNTIFQKYEQQLASAIADVGNRTTRLKLTESRLTEQETSVKELKSKNEDVDLEDVVVNYSSAELVYNASLSSASKVVRQSLLDFL